MHPRRTQSTRRYSYVRSGGREGEREEGRFSTLQQEAIERSLLVSFERVEVP